MYTLKNRETGKIPSVCGLQSNLFKKNTLTGKLTNIFNDFNKQIHFLMISYIT